MPLKGKAQLNIRKFDFGISYKINEQQVRLREAQNVFMNQGRLETIYGYSRFNEIRLPSEALSMSRFKKGDGSRYLFAKCGTELLLVSQTGTHTVLKSGLNPTSKHHGLTFGDRHIISLGTDGFYLFDGTLFGELGIDVPGAAVLVGDTSSGALPAGDYSVQLTYYSSSTGAESNPSATSNIVTLGSSGKILFNNIPASGNNFFDKIRIYLKKDTGSFNFSFESFLPIGPIITGPTTSTVNPPTKNGKWLPGGGTYMAIFDNKLVYTGNPNYPDDTFFSEPEEPWWFDPGSATQIIVNSKGDGPNTGLGIGFYSAHNLEGYLIIFKKDSFECYSNLNDFVRQATVSGDIGCVEGDTVIYRGAQTFYLSAAGWRAISQGIPVVKLKNIPITLGDGVIDDIFKSPNFEFAVDKSQFSKFHSVMYSELDQYFTFVVEKGYKYANKAYVYDFRTDSFYLYDFDKNITSSCFYEDASLQDSILFADNQGWIYRHSVAEAKGFVDSNNVKIPIHAYAQLTWLESSDYDASFNFREMIIRCINAGNPIYFRVFKDLIFDDFENYSIDQNSPAGEFILDVSHLDIDSLGYDRGITIGRTDLNIVGQSICIELSQNVIDGNIGLIALQLDYSKNGNRN